MAQTEKTAEKTPEKTSEAKPKVVDKPAAEAKPKAPEKAPASKPKAPEKAPAEAKPKTPEKTPAPKPKAPEKPKKNEKAAEGAAEAATETYPPLKPRVYAKVTLEDTKAIRDIPLDKIYAPDYDSRIVIVPADAAFLESLKCGQNDPVKVARMDDPAGMYELIDGRRRFDGAQQLGWKTIEARLTMVQDIKGARILALTSNNNRANLSTFENAVNVDMLMKTYGYKQADVAREIGKTEAYVSQLLSILRLPPPVLEMVKEGRFGREHGDNILGKCRAICRLKELEQQLRVAEFACRVDAQSVINCVRIYCAVRDKDAAKKDDVLGKSNLDPRVADLALYGKLEPDTIKRCQVIAKIRAFDQQYEMASVLAEHTANAIDEGKAPPTIEDLEAWIEELRKQTAANSGTEEEEEEGDTSGKSEFKPLSATQLRDKYEELRVKYQKYEKTETPDPIKVARNKGTLRGIRIAGGLS